MNECFPSRILDFSGCSELENLPEVLESSREIYSLQLKRSAIKMLPSSIELLSGLKELSLRYCKNLESLPNSLCNLTKLRKLDLSGCFGVEKMLENVLSSSSSGLGSLRELDLCECYMLVFPSALSCLSSLTWLCLRGNHFESLSLKHFTSLTRLDIRYCTRLKYLQEPSPSRLRLVDTSYCISLETLPDTTVVSTRERDISQHFLKDVSPSASEARNIWYSEYKDESTEKRIKKRILKSESSMQQNIVHKGLLEEEAETKNMQADTEVITWAVVLVMIKTRPTTLKEIKESTHTHLSKSKNLKRRIITNWITVEDVAYENSDHDVSCLWPSKELKFHRLVFQRTQCLV
ncbi:hypothetical protein Ddye_019203 [Dipteronia dyeriana]|uniref:Disease resistance protein RPS4B/Roq1-like leucine-rich repeats domain-containing protein n=1 Tax=Dipteronia dyeriana TaxID=168575 RepID=A0AAD9TXZ1_9ROSI|nr:hypothetical protein Ddye_019203 [Dipteronia dyeriana]